jgi:Ca2+-transporting ATPase
LSPSKDIFDAAQVPGLDEEEATRRHIEEGPNELPSTKKNNIFNIAIEVAQEPMFLLLVACGSLYLILGELREAAMLLGFVFLVMGITIVQERKTERALEALRDLSSPRALVIRGRAQRRIPGREVVRGDIIVVSEGDRIPADARLFAAVNLSVDESMLTGESVAVRKRPLEEADVQRRPGGEDSPYIYSGSLVVNGKGIAEVIGIGFQTEMGKIGKALQTLKEEETLLKKETERIVKIFSVLGIGLCFLLVLIYGLTRGNWLEGLLAGIALAMAILPEEFPVVLTIFLAMGAWRISQKGVLTRRIPAVETLGAATVLCVDKTGTLTLNQMKVGALCSDGISKDLQERRETLPEELHALLEYAILASQKDPFDPMEKAILKAGDDLLKGTEHLHYGWSLVREYALTPELLAMSNVWCSPERKDWIIAAKGAPEAIMDLCHLDPSIVEQVESRILLLADNGLRVLGIARAKFSSEEDLPIGQHDFKFEFIGLVGLLDPVRPDVPKAIQECYAAGIRTIMITGDYPGTARNIARAIGLNSPDLVITGQELDSLDEITLREKIQTVNVFARVIPEQKLRIVEALKANGEITAMTGDGVNDAPALKSAHIGIAMGGRGTDVARESAGLVLVDDAFSSIAKAVRMGRRIFDNIRKALAFVVAVHVPIAGMSLLPVFFSDWPMVLLPVHIVFLELIIDPTCSVVFEAEEEEEDVMQRLPRDRSKPLFDIRTVLFALFQGFSILCVVALVFTSYIKAGSSPDRARALAFSTLVFSNLALILTNRSWTKNAWALLKIPNRAFWSVLVGSILFLAASFAVGPLKAVFKFETLSAMEFAKCFGLGLALLLWFELIKTLFEELWNIHSRKKHERLLNR